MAKSVELKAEIPGRGDVKVFMPKAFSSQDKWPLIISLHGYGGSGALQNFYVRLRSFYNDFGFVFAAPDGLKDSSGRGYWNASNFCCDFDQSQVDDVAYIKGLIDRIKNSNEIGRIDLNKIFLIGYSNGAFLTTKLACSTELNIAGIVSISGTSDARDASGDVVPVNELNCEHNRPIPMLHVHGTADKTILYDGFDNGRTAHVGALEHISRWAKHNGCKGSLKSHKESFNASNFIKGKETDQFAMQDCLAPVEHFRVNDGGHFGVFKKKLTKKILQFLFQ